MVWGDIAKLLIAAGIGSVVVALIQGLFTRGSTKATAAKLVTESAKLANDMVRDIAEDLRTDNDSLRATAVETNSLIKELRTDIAGLNRRVDTLTDALEMAIPIVEVSHPSKADQMRRLLVGTDESP